MFKAGSNYLPRLNAIVAKQVADEQQLKGFFDKKVEVNGTENFYITDNADLVIVYPPYAVAPYAAGTIEYFCDLYKNSQTVTHFPCFNFRKI